jgi:hypothetical protein
VRSSDLRVATRSARRSSSTVCSRPPPANERPLHSGRATLPHGAPPAWRPKRKFLYTSRLHGCNLRATLNFVLHPPGQNLEWVIRREAP